MHSIYTRFIDIVNTPRALGKTSQPKEQRPKKTAFEGAKDLNSLSIDDLIGSLISYEEDLTVENGDED